MKNIFTLLALLYTVLSFSQASGQTTSVNDYKYVVLPEQFEFLKTPNQYNLNSLTKMMLEKYGFTVFYTNEKMPDELAIDKCKALYANLNRHSALLSTHINVSLKDCNGVTVYQTETGKSKEKEYKKAYIDALRQASRSFDNLNYKYSGATIVTVSKPITKTEVVEVFVPSSDAAASATQVVNEATLFAQPIANGFQLVDSTPKVVLKMYKTSQANSYTAISDLRNGVVFKKGNEWFFEYYDNDKLISEKLNIKF